MRTNMPWDVALPCILVTASEEGMTPYHPQSKTYDRTRCRPGPAMCTMHHLRGSFQVGVCLTYEGLLVGSHEAARFLCIVSCCLGEAILTYEKQQGRGLDSGAQSLSVAEMWEMGRGCLLMLRAKYPIFHVVRFPLKLRTFDV